MIATLQRYLIVLCGALLCEWLLSPLLPPMLSLSPVPQPQPQPDPPASTATAPARAASGPSAPASSALLAGAPFQHDWQWRVVERARIEVERAVRYDASYRRIPYPGGDVPADVGACTDLVVRALRAAEVDLQLLVHEDTLLFPERYPDVKGSLGDANIDHRRVPTLFTYFEYNADALEPDPWKPVFEPGDVVFYSEKPCPPHVPCPARHVALVSDRIGRRGIPLVLQNGGPRAVESDALDQVGMVGHFRVTKAMRARSLSNELVFWSALPNATEDAPRASLLPTSPR